MSRSTTDVIEFTDPKVGHLLEVNRYTVDMSPADYELELRNSGVPYFIDNPRASKSFEWLDEDRFGIYGTFHDPAHPASDPALLTFMGIMVNF